MIVPMLLASAAAVQVSATSKAGSPFDLRLESDLDQSSSAKSLLMLERRSLLAFREFGAGSRANIVEARLDSVEAALKELNTVADWRSTKFELERLGFSQLVEDLRQPRGLIQARSQIDPNTGVYSSHFQGPDNASTVARDVKAMRWLVGVTSDGDARDVLGTAFHVRNGWFVTARHVLQARFEAGLNSYCVTAPAESDIIGMAVPQIERTSVRFHPTEDICLFRLRSSAIFPAPSLESIPVFECPPQVPQTPCVRGDIVGYGAGSIFPVATRNVLLISSNGRIIRGLGTTWSGYSGAPLLTRAGNIVGLMTRQAAADRTADGAPTVLPVDPGNAFTALDLAALASFLPPVTDD